MKVKTVLFFSLLLACLVSTSQNPNNSWSLNFTEKPNWTSVDKRTNVIYYYDNSHLKAYDYVLNKDLWSISLPDYKGASFYYKDASPLLRINDTKALSVVSNKSVVINRYTGDVVFESSKIKDFNDSKIFYTRDERYAVILNKEVIKKDKKNNIKRKVNWYLTLVKMNNSETLWTTILPETKLGFLGKNFEFGFVCTDTTLFFNYDSNLLAYGLKDGELKWERNQKESNISMVRISSDKKKFLSIYRLDNSDFAMNFESIDTGKNVWDKPFELGRYYNIKFAPSQVIVKCANGFNYIGYDGSKHWPENISIKGKIEKVYAQGSDHLIISKLNDKYFANWISKDGSHAFENPVFLGNNRIIEGIKMDDYLLVIAPTSILTYDLKNKKRIALLPTKNNIIYAIDKENKSLIFKYGKKDTPVVLKYMAEKPEVLVKKIPYTRKKDTIMRIESFKGNYSFVSRHEVVKTDNVGNEISRLYFKPPSKALKTIASVGAIVLGTVFAEEAGKINREIYRAGLKDMDDFSNELTTLVYFNEFGSAELGMGVVAGSTVNDMLNKFEKEIKYNPYTEIKKLWFHRDKLSTGKWGLRVVNLENTEEKNQVEIVKDKNFSYQVDADSKIIISSTDKNIQFFKFN